MAERRQIARRLEQRATRPASERRRREAKAAADTGTQLAAVSRAPSERRKREAARTA